MNEDRVKTVLCGIDALIAEELASDQPGRYARIARLCGHAGQIAQMVVKRVVAAMDNPLRLGSGLSIHVDPTTNLEPYEGGVEDLPQMPATRIDGSVDLMRELTAVLQRQVEAREKPTPLSPIEEAQQLLELRLLMIDKGRDDIEVEAIDQRIDELVGVIAPRRSKERPGATP